MHGFLAQGGEIILRFSQIVEDFEISTEETAFWMKNKELLKIAAKAYKSFYIYTPLFYINYLNRLSKKGFFYTSLECDSWCFKECERPSGSDRSPMRWIIAS